MNRFVKSVVSTAVAAGFALAGAPSQAASLQLQFIEEIVFGQPDTLRVVWVGDADPGITVVKIADDHWTVSLDPQKHSLSGGSRLTVWQDLSGGFNAVQKLSDTELEVFSDLAADPGGAGPFSLGVSFTVGFDPVSGDSMFAAYYEVARAPAPASLALLGLGLVGLGLGRRRAA